MVRFFGQKHLDKPDGGGQNNAMNESERNRPKDALADLDVPDPEKSKRKELLKAIMGTEKSPLLRLREKKTAPRPCFFLAPPGRQRYCTVSTPAGPLPQGMLSLGGFFFSPAGLGLRLPDLAECRGQQLPWALRYTLPQRNSWVDSGSGRFPSV